MIASRVVTPTRGDLFAKKTFFNWSSHAVR
jgi:hypothetical protein